MSLAHSRGVSLRGLFPSPRETSISLPSFPYRVVGGCIDHAVSEAVACGLVLLLVVLEIRPQLVAQNILVGNLGGGQEDAADVAVRDGLHVIEREPVLLAEAHDVRAFPVLGDKARRVDQLVGDVVSKVFGQHGIYRLERAPTVVREQVLHVLQEERLRLLRLDDSRHVEEQCALGLVLEAGGTAHALFLGDAGDGERHARRPW